MTQPAEDIAIEESKLETRTTRFANWLMEREERRQDGHAHQHLVAASHGLASVSVASASPAASGRPSMNCRTIGSWVR